jgi:hypothetical protein
MNQVGYKAIWVLSGCGFILVFEELLGKVRFLCGSYPIGMAIKCGDNYNVLSKRKNKWKHFFKSMVEIAAMTFSNNII